MLKSITLDNYMTFFDESGTKIDFSASNYKFLKENIGSDNILKGALFVGENASGKTNTLKAIRLLLDLLSSRDPINFPRYKSFYTKKDTYTLKYEFCINGASLIYEISNNIKGISKEKLTLNDEVIVDRKGGKAEYKINDQSGNASLVDPTLPFLRQLYFNTHFYGHKILNKWYDFVANSVYIDCAERRLKTSDKNHNDADPRIYLENNGVQEINELFKRLNYKQSIMYNTETPASKKSGFRAKSTDKFVSFKKDGTDVYVPEWFESTGNRTLAYILPAFIYAIKHDCMLVVNEFSSGLLNQLEESLIKYFYSKSGKSQLFFTTHSTNVISNALIRPDQIYSVRFNNTKGSVFSRFSDQNPREAQNTEKMYLNGVFDEVPNYTTKF